VVVGVVVDAKQGKIIDDVTLAAFVT